MEENDVKFMREALSEAKTSFDLGEVPVGAVIVRDGRIIARGHNLTEKECDPTVHAEMNALREAARRDENWRLPGCTMYVTLEPCAMCAGAMIWARIERLVIGADDPGAGAAGTVFDVAGSGKPNHTIEVERGVLAEECGDLIKKFFKELRK